MSNTSPSRGKCIVNSRANRRDHAAYMREYRAKIEVRERPVSRVVDRTIAAAVGLYVSRLPPSDGIDLLKEIHAFCTAGLEVEGYDRRAAVKATSMRLKALVEAEAVNPVRSAAKAQAAGRPHAGFRVRHESRLETT